MTVRYIIKADGKAVNGRGSLNCGEAMKKAAVLAKQRRGSLRTDESSGGAMLCWFAKVKIGGFQFVVYGDRSQDFAKPLED